MADIDPNPHAHMATEDSLLFRLSHELRTPLNAAYQFVTIVLDNIAGPLSDEQREYLEIVLRNINQLRCMIGDLLEVHRIDSGRIRLDRDSTDISPVITEIVTSLSPITAGKRVSLAADVPDQLPPACIDPRRFRQIVINLVENAVKFTPEGGSVTLTASQQHENTGYLCVSVTDTGRGIRKELHQKIFDRTYQAKHGIETSRKGLGIGLYICRALVHAHGGRIWVESRPGAGSTFSFTIPVWPQHDMRAGDSEPVSRSCA